MSTLTTRAGKGSPLTHDEVDANFTNLNTDKAETTSVVCYVSNASPSAPSGQSYLWVQTGLGVGGTDFTFWINT